MNALVILALVFVGGCLCLSCAQTWVEPDWDELYKQREQAPHVVLKIAEADDGCDIFNARVHLRGLDSIFDCWHGECRVYGQMGHTWSVVITHPRFHNIDTIISLREKSVDTIFMKMTRASRDSALPDKATCDYKAGWENAEFALKDTNGYIFLQGGLRRSLLDIDTATGLPLRGNPTCIVTPFLREFAKGHNDRMAREISTNGMPRNSKKPWISIVINPETYLDSCKKSRSTANLIKDSTFAFSPDGAFKVRLLSLPENNNSYGNIAITGLPGHDTKVARIFGRKKFDKVTLAFGPPESRLLVVRAGKVYSVIDMMQCEILNIQ